MSDSTEISITSQLGSGLMRILMADDIKPGMDPSYQLCKDIYLYHPLGQKMAEAPINVAQSQPRLVTVQDAPDEVAAQFIECREQMAVDLHIHNAAKLARMYGLSSLVAVSKAVKSNEPFDMAKLWETEIEFNELDPLNTAGSLVMTQIPTENDFNKPARVISNGQEFNRSRYVVVMNEQPIYLAYTVSAFGFVGRSVYQRPLFPLKSFIRTMISDDMIAAKLGLLVVKQKPPGSIADKLMALIAGIKRQILKDARTGHVLMVDKDEDIHTLDMQNVDGAGTFARGNILKNIATAADMPARMLENETMVSGFGEGTEDAGNEAKYIDRVRIWMNPLYRYFDNFCQYRAWSPPFYERMRKKYSDQYSDMSYEEAFSLWRSNFAAVWPNSRNEPESEAVKTEEVKLEAVINVLGVLLPVVDPVNKVKLIQSSLDLLSDNKRLFPRGFEIDEEELLEFLVDNQKREKENHELEGKATEASFKRVDFSPLREAVRKLGKSPKRLTLAAQVAALEAAHG